MFFFTSYLKYIYFKKIKIFRTQEYLAVLTSQRLVFNIYFRLHFFPMTHCKKSLRDSRVITALAEGEKGKVKEEKRKKGGG